MRETLISFISCQDDEFLWCYDEAIGSLIKVNIKTLQTQCVLSPMQISEDRRYEVRKIIAWKNKIIILPKEIGKKWTIYDKWSEKVEYIDFCSENYNVTDAILKEDSIVLIPISIKDPIVIIDLKKRKIIKTIEFPSIGYLSEGYIWNARIEQDDIYFLIHDSFFYGCLNNNKLSLIKIDASDTLSCADFYMGIGWAVDCQGKNLYSFDKQGKILGKYPIEFSSYFIRIVVKDKHIYLLPYSKEKIQILNFNGELVKKIDDDTTDSRVLELVDLPAYWDYVEVDSEIWFLPLGDSLHILNKDTLIEKKDLIEYTEIFSEIQYKEYYHYISTTKNKLFFLENSTNITLKKYLKYIEDKRIVKKNLTNCSDYIWMKLNNEV